MEKMSRKTKYQDLRESIANDQDAPESTAGDSSTVLDSLVGEVNEYNLKNGNRVSEDTQLNILSSLGSADRKDYIENMEEKEEEPGDVTRNVFSSGLPEAARTVRKPLLSDEGVKIDDDISSDNLNLISFGEEDLVIPEETKLPKAEAKPDDAKADNPTDELEVKDEEPAESRKERRKRLKEEKKALKKQKALEEAKTEAAAEDKAEPAEEKPAETEPVKAEPEKAKEPAKAEPKAETKPAAKEDLSLDDDDVDADKKTDELGQIPTTKGARILLWTLIVVLLALIGVTVWLIYKTVA